MTELEIERLLEDVAVVSIIIYNEIEEWYIIPVDYWVMNHWGQFSISDEYPDSYKEIRFLELVEKYKVTYEKLVENYKIIEDKRFLIPRVFANFDTKKMLTNYGEWSLEDSVLDTWIGERDEFKDLILEEKQYWK